MARSFDDEPERGIHPAFVRLPVQMVMSRAATQQGKAIDMTDDTVTYLNPMFIDTFTRMTTFGRVHGGIPVNAQSVIRYVDPTGARLIYVKDSVEWLARALRLMGQGRDPGSIKFGKIPDGL